MTSAERKWKKKLLEHIFCDLPLNKIIFFFFFKLMDKWILNNNVECKSSWDRQNEPALTITKDWSSSKRECSAYGEIQKKPSTLNSFCLTKQLIWSTVPFRPIEDNKEFGIIRNVKLCFFDNQIKIVRLAGKFWLQQILQLSITIYSNIFISFFKEKNNNEQSYGLFHKSEFVNNLNICLKVMNLKKKRIVHSVQSIWCYLINCTLWVSKLITFLCACVYFGLSCMLVSV